MPPRNSQPPPAYVPNGRVQSDTELMSALGQVKPMTVGDVMRQAKAQQHEQRIFDQVVDENTSIEQEMHLRNEREAARANMTLREWMDLSEGTRLRLSRMAEPFQEGTGPVHFIGGKNRYGQENRLTNPDQAQNLNSPSYFEQWLAENFDPLDYENFVPMFSPVQEVRLTEDGPLTKYHERIAKIPRLEIRQKWSAGWRLDQSAPMLPHGTIECPMRNSVVLGVMGARCPYRGRTDEDIEVHMTWCHPEENRGRLRKLDNERRDREIDASRRAADASVAQAEASRAQADAMRLIAERTFGQSPVQPAPVMEE